jgi:hypothetical protein
MVDIWLYHPKKFLTFYTFCSKEFFFARKRSLSTSIRKEIEKEKEEAKKIRRDLSHSAAGVESRQDMAQAKARRGGGPHVSSDCAGGLETRDSGREREREREREEIRATERAAPEQEPRRGEGGSRKRFACTTCCCSALRQRQTWPFVEHKLRHSPSSPPPPPPQRHQ